MNDFIELRTILSALLRRWWVLVLIPLIAVGMGYLVSRMQEPVYRATTSMAVDKVIAANGLKLSDIEAISQLIRTNADLAIRQPILEQVVQTLALPESWQQLQARVRTTPLENSQVLEISAEASTREDAVNLANAVAQQLLLFNTADSKPSERQAQSTFAQARMDELTQQIAASQQQLDTLKSIQASTAVTNSNAALWSLWLNPEGSINPLDPSGDRTRKLNDEVTRLERLIIDWEKSYDRWKLVLQENSSFKALTIVEPAQASATPVRPRTGINLLVAGGIGLILALGLIGLLEQFDTTLKLSDDLAKLAKAPLLGAVRRLKGKHNPLLLYQESPAPVVEDYRALHNKIQVMCSKLPKTILVTSPTGGDGRSTVAANLGVMAAQAGYRTIVVDADGKQPVQHEIFQLPNTKGLQQLLFNGAEPNIPLWTIDRLPNLMVLANGQGMGHSQGQEAENGQSTAWWRAQRTGQVLAQLTAHADVIIIDGPALLTAADATTLAGQVDGVILLVEANRTKRSALQEAHFALAQAQANLIGVVLNRATAPINSDLIGRAQVTTPMPAPTTMLKTTAAPLLRNSNGNGLTSYAAKPAETVPENRKRVVLPLRSAKNQAGQQNGGTQHPLLKREKSFTFEELGVDAFTLQGRVNSLTMPMTMQGGQAPTIGDQVRLDLVSWLDHMTADTPVNGVKHKAILTVELNGMALGDITLEKSGAHTATLTIPALPPIITSDGTYFLQVSLHGKEHKTLPPEIIVVVRGTSRLVLTARRQLAMVGE